MPDLLSAGPVLGPSVADLLSAYRTGLLTPSDVVRSVLARIEEHGDDGTWISVVSRDDMLRRAAELEQHADPWAMPLFGVPFGVKDSIDIAGMATTVGCPDYAYVASETAAAVARLLDAGGILVGKTNLDQFATGLNGTRTPYPIPRSVFGGDLICGGSSSGSALAVASGVVPFSVATDTAGSGRVPPALNGIAGFKPSRGLVSTVGLVPACRSLDCMSVVAGRVQDLRTVFDVMASVDERDPSARARRREAPVATDLRVGLPDATELDFFGDEPMRAAHLAARARIEHHFAHTTAVPIGPFLDAGALLYSGPWVAERLTEFGDFLTERAESVLPVVRAVLENGRRYTATDVFEAQHRLNELKVRVSQLWCDMDVLVLPAVGTTFTVDQVVADPIRTNTVLGHYTHFGNLLDLCAAVVPGGRTSDGRPAALMILGPALSDDRVLAVAAALTGESDGVGSSSAKSVPDSGITTLVVVGHHLAGEPLSGDLTSRGGVRTRCTLTAPIYRLMRVGAVDHVPALVWADSGGGSVEVETWTIPASALAEILAAASPSVCLGRVLLADGTTEIGFVADASVVGDRSAVDITEFGGWRGYRAARSAAPVSG